MTIEQITTSPYHLCSSEGPALWHLGGLLTVKAGTNNTAGQLMLLESLSAFGQAPPLHTHTREDEGFYILEGELTMHVGAQRITATAGSFVWAPRGVPHAFCVESD